MTATNKRKRIEGERILMVDVDDTLVLWDYSKHLDKKRYETKYKNRKIRLAIHQKNINLLKKFFLLDYTILVWSGSGIDWAQHVCVELGLDSMVTNYLTKPLYMLDDMPAKHWSRRLWRDPDTGSSIG